MKSGGSGGGPAKTFAPELVLVLIAVLIADRVTCSASRYLRMYPSSCDSVQQVCVITRKNLKSQPRVYSAGIDSDYLKSKLRVYSAGIDSIVFSDGRQVCSSMCWKQTSQNNFR